MIRPPLNSTDPHTLELRTGIRPLSSHWTHGSNVPNVHSWWDGGTVGGEINHPGSLARVMLCARVQWYSYQQVWKGWYHIVFQRHMVEFPTTEAHECLRNRGL